jgi:signal transduction histidine kinase
MPSAGNRVDPGTVPGRADGDGAIGTGDDASDRGVRVALALARVIVAVVFCGYAVVALLSVLDSGKSAAGIAVAVAALSGLLSIQYFYFSRPSTDPHSPRSYAVLVAQACLAYLPLVLFGPSWVSQPTFLAGSVLLVLPLPLAWPAFAAIVASTAIAQAVTSAGGPPLDMLYVAVNTATAGLYVYGLTRLAMLVTALHEARDELAKTTVAHERLRFARDLHDLLGLSLSAIAPKGEVTLRLIRRNPERAKQELSEILEISRRALADVRSIARVYREISLEDETGTLASMLAASNVELRVDLDGGEFPPHMRATLATILREGVGYVLRHRKVERCEIVLRRHGDSIVVDIVNDTVGDSKVVDSDGGGDFDNLSALASRTGGELTAGMAAGGRFRLRVTLPVAARSRDHREENGDETGTSIPHLATKLAGGLVVAVFCGFFVQAVLRLLYVTTDFSEIASSTGWLLAVLALQLGYFSRPGTRLNSRVAYLVLGAQALLVYLPLLEFREAWTGLPGFLAGSALLVLRPAAGWSVFVGVVGTVAWAQVGFGAILPKDIGLNIALTVSSGLVTYGVMWMARTVRQLRAARQELAKVALAETRLRFARDLHDLLGLSLSAITLKSELAYRLILLDPDRARTELEEVLEISRHALADVRSVASGYHEMSLDEECRTAESLLTTAELDVRMTVEHGELPPEVSTVLATVLREGVTNVLRHSKGERCEITIREDGDHMRLHIANDGVTEPPVGEDHWGSGIRNMSERVGALGGVLTAGFEGDGNFGLCVRVPLSAAS